MYIRRNVWELGGDWADPIIWYARGVAAMKSKAIAEPTSWKFYGAMHGIDKPLWQHFGYFKAAEPLPSAALVKRYWKQCQHGSWYFLPWHRGYLLAFEANVRDAVVKLGGPKDWALPYWNYFKPQQFKLPPAFGSPDWPDGKGNNPLFVHPRWGPNSDGNVFVDVTQVSLDAMSDRDFTGVSSGGSPGFGGVDTGFEHGGPVHGGIETQPHDYVHGLVGGLDPDNQNVSGLMGDPDTAGLDPIFWLHHVNIDRLWEVWRKSAPGHADPTDPKWVKGPTSIGERSFSMPMPAGKNWDFTPADMEDLEKLGYGYDDLSRVPGVAAPEQRLIALGFEPAAAGAITQGPAAMASKKVELIGANQGPLALQGNGADSSVTLDPAAKTKVVNSLSFAPQKPAPPDRVFLNLENVRGTADATALHVYVGVPEGANPSQHPENLAGNIALFGVRKASDPQGEHAGQGLTYVLDISKIIDKLHLEDRLQQNWLKISVVPVKPIPDETKVSIGRISVYRQGA